MSRYLWSRYDRHFVGIACIKHVALKGEDLPRYWNKIKSVGLRNVHMIIDLLKKHT